MQVYQELKTSNGTLRGFLHTPDNADKYPLVIMFHGFTGHKGESHFLFVQLARFLCANNVASLRFDFLGSGDSDNDFSYMTFSNEVNEALAILDYAKTLPNITDIIILGLSMGGAVATQVAKARPNDINKLVLWAPAGNMNQIILAQQKNQVPQLPNGNYILGGLEISPAFVEDIVKQDLFTGVDVFTNPVLIQHDRNDQAVKLSVSEKYESLYPNCKLIVYDGSDHTFTNVLVRRQVFSDLLNYIRS